MYLVLGLLVRVKQSSRKWEVLLCLGALQCKLYNVAAMGPVCHSHVVDLPKEWLRICEMKEIATCRPPAYLLRMLKGRQWEGQCYRSRNLKADDNLCPPHPLGNLATLLHMACRKIISSKLSTSPPVCFSFSTAQYLLVLGALLLQLWSQTLPALQPLSLAAKPTSHLAQDLRGIFNFPILQCPSVSLGHQGAAITWVCYEEKKKYHAAAFGCCTWLHLQYFALQVKCTSVSSGSSYSKGST